MRLYTTMFLSLCLPCFSFQPWFTGTMLENSSRNQQPGSMNLQSFTIATVEYGQFLGDGTLNLNTDSLSTVTNAVWWEWGVTKWLDFTLYGQLIYANAAENGDAIFFGPTQVLLGFQLNEEKLEDQLPTIRLVVFSQFPTTPYDFLEVGKSYQAGGTGSIQTGGSIVVAKTLFKNQMHPLLANLNLGYYYQFNSTLAGPNTFGGDHTTDVLHNPGNIFTFNLGLELSLSQNWVVQTDINYLYEGNPSFKGERGTISPIIIPGTSQAITLTPGLEYSFSNNLGLFSSFWITAWGKNTSALFGIVFSCNSVF